MSLNIPDVDEYEGGSVPAGRTSSKLQFPNTVETARAQQVWERTKDEAVDPEHSKRVPPDVADRCIVEELGPAPQGNRTRLLHVLTLTCIQYPHIND